MDAHQGRARLKPAKTARSLGTSTRSARVSQFEDVTQLATPCMDFAQASGDSRIRSALAVRMSVCLE
jgi:hypothetical protein